jgi:hypothetical protein
VTAEEMIMENGILVRTWKRGKIVKVYRRWAWQDRALIKGEDGNFFLGAHSHCNLESTGAGIRYTFYDGEPLTPRVGQEILYHPEGPRSKRSVPYVHAWVTIEEFGIFAFNRIVERGYL